MHTAAWNFVRSVAGDRPPGLVVELGARNVNGSVRPLFVGDDYLGVDLLPGAGVDVVTDAADYVPPTPPACVVCCEVLEHTPAAGEICDHAYTMLQPGGALILTAAGTGREPHSAIDGGPLYAGEFYRNVTREDIRHWLRRFEQVSIVENLEAHDVYAYARKGVLCGC